MPPLRLALTSQGMGSDSWCSPEKCRLMPEQSGGTSHPCFSSYRYTCASCEIPSSGPDSSGIAIAYNTMHTKCPGIYPAFEAHFTELYTPEVTLLWVPEPFQS